MIKETTDQRNNVTVQVVRPTCSSQREYHRILCLVADAFEDGVEALGKASEWEWRGGMLLQHAGNKYRTIVTVTERI